jgi:hypothetical protein
LDIVNAWTIYLNQGDGLTLGTGGGGIHESGDNGKVIEIYDIRIVVLRQYEIS